MAEKLKQAEGEEELLRQAVHSDAEDLAVFRWLNRQIPNKKAITACLLVLQGSACSAAPLGVDQAAGT